MIHYARIVVTLLLKIDVCSRWWFATLSTCSADEYVRRSISVWSAHDYKWISFKLFRCRDRLSFSGNSIQMSEVNCKRVTHFQS